MTIGDRIKNIRDKLNLSQVDFADKIDVSKQTLYKYENNIITNIPSNKIEAIAAIGRVSPAYIMGWDFSDISNKKRKGVTINVVGRVAAGIPIEAIENIIDTEEITEELARTGDFFGLQIHGDSMAPNICDGDIVIVRQQEDAETGDIVIATVNGTDATCKRLRKHNEGIELIANNPTYDTLDFSNQEIIEKPVKIIGKIVELRRKF
ncbi:XRE family transcriptional regulator [bacterium C-53]|nr:XRE family transcriptional regulator [Lachnospiraceae bacterium]NBI02961.1 XRE family transcriptional regulator [Lachnospiraceae bacterium]RKJ10582.1 XRE family transcriptional regulator [bacterium C-53]